MRISNFFAIAACASAVACSADPTRQQVFQMSGKEMYGQLCTSCHGVSGKGNGPMAPLLKVDVPDLTRIAQRHDGEFPADHVRRTIDGRFEQRAHGLPYMPVWGLKFHDRENSYDMDERARVDSIIDRLVDYLASIQTTSSAEPGTPAR